MSLMKNLLTIAVSESENPSENIKNELRKKSELIYDRLEEISNVMRSFGIQEANYDIVDNDGKEMMVNVRGDVDLSYRNLESIPVKFGVVTGGFWVVGNKLKNLKNAPYRCNMLNAKYNEIESLYDLDDINKIYFPIDVSIVDLSNNKLMDTRGITGNIKELNLANNNLKTIKHLPKKLNYLDLSNNTIKFNNKILDKYNINVKNVVF